jgi:membrane-bound lytic murein transglycosylase B
LVYPGIITPANLERSRDYMRVHPVPFALMSRRYAVPKEIVVSLLFVETKLGNFLGKNNAFMTLASMALSTTPDYISEALAQLPVTPERLDWVKQVVVQRSDWAYAELKALIVHARESALDPLRMPGSVYGAVGICQFMPSNVHRYAADGNDDGKIDLFDPADAIMSVGNYLSGHGWKKNMDKTARRNVLKRYNNSTIYADTILTMAEALNPPPAKKTVTTGKGKKGKKPVQKLPQHTTPKKKNTASAKTAQASPVAPAHPAYRLFAAASQQASRIRRFGGIP